MVLNYVWNWNLKVKFGSKGWFCYSQNIVLGISFGVATLLIYSSIVGGGAWFISARWTIPKFPEIFPGIEFVSIIYVRYCSSSATFSIDFQLYPFLYVLQRFCRKDKDGFSPFQQVVHLLPELGSFFFPKII